MRKFEYAVRTVDGETVQAYPEARFPEYQTKYSAGADFFCAEEVVIPSVWKQVAEAFLCYYHCLFLQEDCDRKIVPTLVHTGIKARMEPDEVLTICNRSSLPKKKGLVLANGVGIIDADYYGNPDNDGEIMFAFYNLRFHDVTVPAGHRIGQGIFSKVLRPMDGFTVKEAERTGGFGHTGEK